MRIINTILYITVLFSFTSCSVMWDYVVLPFSGADNRTDLELESFFPDCEYVSYSIDNTYNDEVLNGEDFCINIWKYEHGGIHSPMQTIMFDSNGDCLGAYEFCMGNAQYLDVYKDVPIFRKNIYNNVILDKLKLSNYIKTIDTDADVKENLLHTCADYDYIIVVLWTDYHGYYMKRHLRQVKRYVNKHKDEMNFRTIYLKLCKTK